MSYGPYSVEVWREDNNGWSATADQVDGAFTAGDSLAEIERNAKEAIAAALDLPRGAEVSMTLDLTITLDHGGPVDQLVAAARDTREAASRSAHATQAAVTKLRQHGLSTRDVSRLIGITPGRVSQIDRTMAA